MKLELGAGNHPTEGYVHHDQTLHDAWIDLAFDLESAPWPVDDSSCEEVVALDVLEHIRPWRLDIEDWVAELWRILTPYGTATLRLPAWDNAVSYRDPTHYKVFHEETFDYWDPNTQLWQDYGRYYFADRGWFHKIEVKRVNGSDLQFILQKIVPNAEVDSL